MLQNVSNIEENLSTEYDVNQSQLLEQFVLEYTGILFHYLYKNNTGVQLYGAGPSSNALIETDRWCKSP